MNNLIYKSLCRHCKHPENFVDTNGLCFASSREIEWLRCNCPLYEPSDNLEYLELKAEQKDIL